MNEFVTKVPADKNKTQEESTLGPYVELMLDRNFKLFFASPKRKELLLAMLQEFLPEVGIVSIEIGPQERIGRDIHLTNSVFDVSCTTADGKSIVVEAQYNARKDYLDRMLYYSTWPIDEQIKRGKKEKNYFLKPIYILSFTNFALIHDDAWEAVGWDVTRDGEKVVSSYTIREDSNGEKMTEALHFRYVELGRFNKKRGELRSSRDRWLFYLKNLGKLKKELPQKEGGDAVDRLVQEARVEGMTPEEKIEYYKNMRNEFDIESEKWFAREDGIKEGEARGLAKGREEKTEIVKNLKALGIDVKKISQATGLSEDAIAAL